MRSPEAPRRLGLVLGRALALAASSLALAALLGRALVWATAKVLGNGSQATVSRERHGLAAPGGLPLLPARAAAPPAPAFNVTGARAAFLGVLTLLVVALALIAGIEAIVADHRPDDFDPNVPPPARMNADLLEGYGWVSQPGGAVRIPIERAMQLLAERGLPYRPTEEAAEYRDAGLGGPTDSSGGQWPPAP